MGTTAFVESSARTEEMRAIETLQRLASVRDQKGSVPCYPWCQFGGIGVGHSDGGLVRTLGRFLSHHVEGNVREREKRFLKQAASEVAQILDRYGLQHLIIGIREETLAMVLPIFSVVGLSKSLAGHFHLPNLDMGAEQIFECVDKVMANHRDTLRASFWQEIHQHPDRAAIGLRQTLEALRAGRVQKLVLGADACQAIGECTTCGGYVTGDGNTCPSCASSITNNMAAGEYLLRKAL